MLNNHLYPKISYPELYILEGGYCGFFNSRPVSLLLPRQESTLTMGRNVASRKRIFRWTIRSTLCAATLTCMISGNSAGRDLLRMARHSSNPLQPPTGRRAHRWRSLLLLPRLDDGRRRYPTAATRLPRKRTDPVTRAVIFHSMADRASVRVRAQCP